MKNNMVLNLVPGIGKLQQHSLLVTGELCIMTGQITRLLHVRSKQKRRGHRPGHHIRHGAVQRCRRERRRHPNKAVEDCRQSVGQRSVFSHPQVLLQKPEMWQDGGASALLHFRRPSLSRRRSRLDDGVGRLREIAACDPVCGRAGVVSRGVELPAFDDRVAVSRCQSRDVQVGV